MDPDQPTVIDARAQVEGRLSGRDAQVRGRFRGEIELAGRLVVGEGAVVEGRARAESAEIAGRFTGDLAVARLALLEKARVEGTVAARLLSMREGAVLDAAVEAGPARPAPPPEPVPDTVVAG